MASQDWNSRSFDNEVRIRLSHSFRLFKIYKIREINEMQHMTTKFHLKS